MKPTPDLERLIGLEFMPPGGAKKRAYAQRLQLMAKLRNAGQSIAEIAVRFEITPGAVRAALKAVQK
jgi:hypothetical protein